ncbi:MAG: MauE/DoxX family redox-associated membrane protein [Jatrophihabitantaceae bacterium]
MNWNSVRGWLGTLIRLVLGVVWIWAAWSKLHSPRTFVQAVRAYDATPEWLSKAIGYGLPVLEFCLGVLLIVGVAVRLAALVSGLLFVVFLIGLIQAAARGLQLECGCFGGGGESATTSYTLDILRDIGLLILAAYLVIWSTTRLSVEEFLARNDHVEAPSAKRMRTDKGARKYNAMLDARRKEARERTMYINLALGIVVVLVAVIGIGVQSGRAKIAGDLTATNASATNGVVYGKKASATIDIYEDFQCPHCLEFEQAVGPTLDKDVKANLAQVRFHSMSFLDSSSNGNRYSSRAANAALCASDISVDDFVKYHNYLYGKDKSGTQIQPKEGSNGRTDGELESYASAVGITPSQKTTFDSCVNTEQHKALVQAITEKASERGVNGTPTVYLNGKKLAKTDLASVKAAIAKVDAAGPPPSPSPTPSKTTTPSSPTPTSTKKATPTGSKSP